MTDRGPTLETERLTLRRWRSADVPLLAAMNADPIVMEFFPTILDEAETAQQISRFEDGFEKNGYGWWAVQVTWARTLIGFCGLAPVDFEEHFTPAVEIGWRLAREHWGNGYATEAARATLGFGFGELGLEEIVSFALPRNTRSTGVMKRLGMVPDGEFDHPAMEDPEYRRHVLYRMTTEHWEELASGIQRGSS